MTNNKLEQRCEWKGLFIEVNKIAGKLEYSSRTLELRSECDKCSGYTKEKPCYYAKKN